MEIGEESDSEHGSMRSAPSAEAHPIVYSGDTMSSDHPGSAQVRSKDIPWGRYHRW